MNKIIEQLSAQKLAGLTQQQKRERFSYIISDLKTLKTKIEIKNDELIALRLQKEQLKYLTGIQWDQAQQAYNNQIMGRDIEIEEDELIDYTLQGYEMINQLRQIITKQKIVYRIGIGSKDKDYLHQMTMSYEELSPSFQKSFTVNKDDKTDKITGGNFSIKLQLSQKYLKGIQKIRESYGYRGAIESFVEGGSTLYSTMWRFFTSFKLEKAKDKNYSKTSKSGKVLRNANWGHFYQTYHYLLNQNGNGNDYRPTTSTIIDAIVATLGNGGKKGSFITGGDVKNEQIKGYFGGQPTLTSPNVIINTFNDLINSLEIYIQTNNYSNIYQLLTGEQFGQKVKDKAKIQATQAVKEYFASLTK